MDNVILTDLCGINAILPRSEEEKQVYALRRLNVFAPWPLRRNVAFGDCGRDIGIPSLSACEYTIWAGYLPLFYNTLDKFVLELDRMGRPKEWLPLEVIAQYEMVLKLGIFSELTVWASDQVGDLMLIGSMGARGSSDNTKSYLLARWHNGGRTPTTLDEVKHYLRVTISKKSYRRFDFGWAEPEDILSACCEHDRLVLK